MKIVITKTFEDGITSNTSKSHVMLAIASTIKSSLVTTTLEITRRSLFTGVPSEINQKLLQVNIAQTFKLSSEK